MRILHTADWHIGNFPGPEKEGMNARAYDTRMCINHIHNVCMEEEPDLMVISGDLFHQARVWSDRGLDETRYAIMAIEGFAQSCPVVVLRGTPNHDGTEQFEMLKSHFLTSSNVYIIDSPKAFSLTLPSDEEIQICGLPGFDRGIYRAKFPGIAREEENQIFTQELGKIILGLKAECSPLLPSILLSHYTVPGCSTESGQVQFLSQFEPVLLPEVLDTANFDLVLLGHIHRPQQVPSCENVFYSGAINAFNFNDEGQERGFYIHDLENDIHDFYTTPFRAFKTINLQDEEIAALNFGMLDDVATRRWRGDIDGAIIRVIYECTDERNKALNKATLESELYSDGAFWVQEIVPEKITISANRNNLSEQNTPESNLIEYLMEKAVPDDRIIDLVEAAKPIIAEASAGNITALLSGLFVPVEIEVKNYRNYLEETFSFDDITFCTINGRNGVGKSSLFMDAMLDCLYEEPREGELTGWISNNEKARSGSIKFTFKIGDRAFRVTRTRAKSGKATLNLSELIDGEWENRSKERLSDTQSEIVNILGMDSLTLRSCALIMQDQYGLFLQADKESRMSILGNILGLGVYGDMEASAKDKATEINRQIRQHHDEIERLSEGLQSEDLIHHMLESSNRDLNEAMLKITSLQDQADNVRLKLNTKLEAAGRAEKISKSIQQLRAKEEDINTALIIQAGVVNESNVLLRRESEIVAGVERYNRLLVREKELIVGKALYDTKFTEYLNNEAVISGRYNEISDLNAERRSVGTKKKPYDDRIKMEEQLKAAFDQYQAEKAILVSLEAKSAEYIRISNTIYSAEKALSGLKSTYDSEIATRVSTYTNLSEKAAMLENSGCMDSEHAACRFLADAVDAKAKLQSYADECHKWKTSERSKLETAQQHIDELLKARDGLVYDPKAASEKQTFVYSLERSAKEYEAIAGYKEHVLAFQDRLDGIDAKVSELQLQLKSDLNRRDELLKQLEEMRRSDEMYKELMADIGANQMWIEQEKLLPVAREKKSMAESIISDRNKELLSVAAEISEKQKELDSENQAAFGEADLQSESDRLQYFIKTHNDLTQKLSMDIGGYTKQLENINETKLAMKKLQDILNELSDSATIYDDLKKAFSQDGVPHNIIRSIVPMIEATANSILGQMSGGKMSMEFVTEKVLKSNSKKEVVTLDIIINENGIGRLPYLSKSGGERVKAALSAILALAEIKSSRAGIQLGMLFIDEPPFLDADGIQAYCDALETIQSRYSELKIMAITHDPTMKARFPQSIDIEKTAEGSKVVYAV